MNSSILIGPGHFCSLFSWAYLIALLAFRSNNGTGYFSTLTSLSLDSLFSSVGISPVLWHRAALTAHVAARHRQWRRHFFRAAFLRRTLFRHFRVVRLRLRSRLRGAVRYRQTRCFSHASFFAARCVTRASHNDAGMADACYSKRNKGRPNKQTV